MRNLAKSLVRRTPLWSALRPRRVHVYGVCAPKTGTRSVAKLFGNYRSKHEAHPSWTASLIRKIQRGSLSHSTVRRKVKRREERDRLECESAYYLVHFVEHLAVLYSEAKFVCTVREPRSWLRSIIDQCINNPREHLDPSWKTLRDLSFGPLPEEYPDKESVLERYGLYSLDQYLRYWSVHNRVLLDSTSPKRRVFIRTSALSDEVDRLAGLAGLSTTSLLTERDHVNKASEKHDVLDEIDADYLKEKIHEHCQPIMERLSHETLISFSVR